MFTGFSCGADCETRTRDLLIAYVLAVSCVLAYTFITNAGEL